MNEALVSIAAIRAAAARIAGVAVKTPLVSAPFPGIAGYGAGKEIWLKAESLQPMGAFKIRGALVYFRRLREAGGGERVAVTATRGNFGQAVAFAARQPALFRPAPVAIHDDGNVAGNFRKGVHGVR